MQTNQLTIATNTCPVSSYNEWDLLEEVIVGVVDGAMVPAWHTIYRAALPPDQDDKMNELTKLMETQRFPYPKGHIAAAKKNLEEFVHILESEGVVVRRPEIVDYTASFSTPTWKVLNGFCSANPRDVFIVIGNDIIEAPMAELLIYIPL